ncbi:MAG: helix-turn-helix transcriptional regulator [Oscillospiraceae bacterium]|nr:helix-turn-helix transcriptional regulator [Oscillospiraceae bacterium]
MFYANFLRLCNEAGKAPSAVALELGLEKSTVTRWKQGSKPTDATLHKIADYFFTTPEALLSDAASPDSLAGLDRQLLEAIRTLSDGQKRLLLAQLQLMDDDLR